MKKSFKKYRNIIRKTAPAFIATPIGIGLIWLIGRSVPDSRLYWKILTVMTKIILSLLACFTAGLCVIPLVTRIGTWMGFEEKSLEEPASCAAAIVIVMLIIAILVTYISAYV